MSRFLAPPVALVALTLLATPVLGQRAAGQMKVLLPDREVVLDRFGIEKGSPGAPVWIVELADFGCSYCAKFASETMPKLDSAFTNTGRLYWRFVPFVLGMFPNAKEAAEGSICAAEQAKFWPMHDTLYANRKAWMASKAPTVLIARYARDVGVSPAAYSRCVQGKGVSETLARNNALARSLYVRGTPTFVINGELLPGALPTETFLKGMEAVYKAATRAP
ncbi:MAG: DsbA family protein [Gemmatimonadaceae bacterium]